MVKIFTLSLMLLGVLGAAVQCDQAPPFNPEAPAVVALSKRGFAPPILDLGLGPANVASVWIGGEKATSSTQLSLRWDAAALRDDQMMAFASEGSLRVAPFRDVLLGSVSGTPQLQVDPAWIVAVEWSAAGAQVAVVTVTLLDGGRMGAYELLVLDEALQVVARVSLGEGEVTSRVISWSPDDRRIVVSRPGSTNNIPIPPTWLADLAALRVDTVNAGHVHFVTNDEVVGNLYTLTDGRPGPVVARARLETGGGLVILDDTLEGDGVLAVDSASGAIAFYSVYYQPPVSRLWSRIRMPDGTVSDTGLGVPEGTVRLVSPQQAQALRDLLADTGTLAARP